MIVVTGAGIISAIGVGKDETFLSLAHRRSGIRALKYLETKHRDLPVGEVQLSDDEMKAKLGCGDDKFITRTALLGRIALQEALGEAQLTADDIERTHFISGTTVAGMDRRERHYAHEMDCNADGARIATYNCADCTEAIADSFGRFASLSTISTACSSATNAIIAGADKLLCNSADIVVVGGAESLSKFHLNGFNTLMILDHEQCRPFDKDRKGLNLGEGAAFLVLETLESARRRGVKPQCCLAGYGNACDAFHQTASSPDGEGAFLAMQEAQDMAGLKPSDIDYINAHGTGTPNNDASETVALKRLFGEVVPPFSSTKSFTGHTTSASGAIEAVICLLALQHQFIPVNLNWHTPMDDGLVPALESSPKREIRTIQSNAFGFGGNDSSIILESLSPTLPKGEGNLML